MKRLNREQTQNLLFLKLFVAMLMGILLWKIQTTIFKKISHAELFPKNHLQAPYQSAF